VDEKLSDALRALAIAAVAYQMVEVARILLYGKAGVPIGLK
jgi:hypothetical protein